VRPSTSHLREFVRKRDFYAGGLMILLGLGIALKGATYRGGTLMHMGPGFLPTALGVLLVLLGIAIAAAGLAPSEEDQRILPEHPQWLGWLCILAGPVLFIFFGSGSVFLINFTVFGYNIIPCGMIPGTFACVFVSALGDRTATLLATFILATVVTVFGVGLFSYFLQVPMPVFDWRGGL
jgi:putative Ca2+/H+ antiporter (TMEM165/GDT1 family)